MENIFRALDQRDTMYVHYTDEKPLPDHSVNGVDPQEPIRFFRLDLGLAIFDLDEQHAAQMACAILDALRGRLRLTVSVSEPVDSPPALQARVMEAIALLQKGFQS